MGDRDADDVIQAFHTEDHVASVRPRARQRDVEVIPTMAFVIREALQQIRKGCRGWQEVAGRWGREERREGRKEREREQVTVGDGRRWRSNLSASGGNSPPSSTKFRKTESFRLKFPKVSVSLRQSRAAFRDRSWQRRATPVEGDSGSDLAEESNTDLLLQAKGGGISHSTLASFAWLMLFSGVWFLLVGAESRRTDSRATAVKTVNF